MSTMLKNTKNNLGYAPNDPYNFEKMQTAERKSSLRRDFSKVGISLVLALAVMYTIAFILTALGAIKSISDIEFLNTLSQIASSIASITAFIFAGYFCCKLSKASPGSLISFKTKSECRGIIPYILAASFALFMVSNYMTDLFLKNMELIGLPISQTSLSYEKNWLNLLVYPLSIAVIPALTEEFLFRGVVMGLLRKFGDSFAIVTSSLLFGLMHQNFIQLPFAFIGGLVFGYITIYTGSIIPAMAVHFANNLFSCIFTILPYYIGSSVSETIYLSVIIIAIMLGLYSVYKLSKTDKNTLTLSTRQDNQYSDLLTSEGVKYKYFFQSYGIIVFTVLLFCVSAYMSLFMF